jgi:hypothetical protein
MSSSHILILRACPAVILGHQRMLVLHYQGLCTWLGIESTRLPFCATTGPTSAVPCTMPVNTMDGALLRAGLAYRCGATTLRWAPPRWSVPRPGGACIPASTPCKWPNSDQPEQMIDVYLQTFSQQLGFQLDRLGCLH